MEYVPQVGNVNYPEAAVWFARGGFPQSWQGQLDTMLGQLELDLYVLSPRGANLADTAAMNPIYREICRQAAAKGVRIGMHVPAGTNPLPEGCAPAGNLRRHGAPRCRWQWGKFG